MRKLEDLKTELLADKLDKFYVFYGDDYGIRRHYIDKINSYIPNKVYADSWIDIKDIVAIRTLFSVKKLIIVYNDLDFMNQADTTIQAFINNLIDDNICIFIYDTADFTKSILFKSFNQYITEFQAVQDNIAVEFVDSELNLLDAEKEKLAFNCNNLYNNILLEADKIKVYANALKLSHQSAYEALDLQNQLLVRQEDFSEQQFMDAILTGQYTKLAYWYYVVKNNTDEGVFFRYLGMMFNDFIIAGLIAQHGKYDGGQRAYNYKLSWGRIKILREMEFSFDPEYYYGGACEIAKLDVLVKQGKVGMKDLIDYFLVMVI